MNVLEENSELTRHTLQQENQNKDGFGHISAMTNWKENKNVTSNRFLSGDKVRDEFIKRVDIVGAEVCYRRLKQVLVTTLADGYPEKDSRESMEKDRIKDEVSPTYPCPVVDTSNTDNRMNGSQRWEK